MRVDPSAGSRPARTGPDPPTPPAAAPPDDLAELQLRLIQAEETLRAIRHGEVDALVVQNSTPVAQVFTLSSADRPYRMFVENMRDGAATVSTAGIILYANHRLAEQLACPLAQVIGSSISDYISETVSSALRRAGPDQQGGPHEAELVISGGRRLPVRVNAATLEIDGQELLCLTVADLTEQNAQKHEIARLGLAQADRMQELELAQAALTQQATHDPLTGLPNRSLIIDRLSQALALARRLGRSTGLIFVDLDRFKEINDTGGHAAGDAVLRHIGERLLSAVRPMDSVSRLGGDEFVVLVPMLHSAEGGLIVARRIAAALAVPIQLSHGSVSVSASIGISISAASELGADPDPDRLLRQADTAMYHAKSLGGSRTELFDAAQTPTVLQSDRAMWIERIRHALNDDRLVLHGQPIVELATGRIIQHELLLRMRDGQGGLILPLAFLPTAERCGLIHEIDEWVITRAIAMATDGLAVSVNLSAASAGDPRVLELVGRELREHGTDPSKVIFEITETAVMQNMDRAASFAEHLLQFGCKLALDDFGTGFASFTYIKRLPVQFLKIDIEFIRELVHSQRDRFVVRAIVALATDFGQLTIAEGVEDEATADVLRELGVTYAQGYLYGRPGAVPANPAASVGIVTSVAERHPGPGARRRPRGL
ncbi:MAG TPA: GGDEF domain-containing protein [Solirubrobacteraceae bacterium]|nr:GGDEF domain-containing protein [Solirubrobacteraceae bacterium]